MIRLKDILQIHQRSKKPKIVVIERLSDNFAILLKRIKMTNASNIILDISTEKIVPFLTEAAHVKMLDEYTNYFITNLDTHTLDLAGIPGIMSNITCLRVVDPNSEEASVAMRFWQKRSNFEMASIPLEAALVHDAVQMYFKALLSYTQDNESLKPSKNSCNNPRQSTYGFELSNFIKMQDFDGITGKIEFNNVEPNRGSRTQFKLEVLELLHGEFSNVGYWDTTNKLNYRLKDSEERRKEAIQSKTFKIVSKLGEPFLMSEEVS